MFFCLPTGLHIDNLFVLGGKAFCAGGDVRAVTESAVRGGSIHKDFFREEYRLNALIGTLHIPYIALMDGITMGEDEE